MKCETCCVLTLVLAVLSASIGCAAPAPPVPATAGRQPTGVVSEKSETVTDPWDQWVAEARKEGYLTIYRSSVSFDRAAARFREKYGITVDSLSLNSSEMTARISREYRAGLYNVGVISTGWGGIRLMAPMGLLAPLDDIIILPEVLDNGKWFGGQLPLVDRYAIEFSGAVGTYIWRNTELVGPKEIKEHRDLLNPRWKGKIILDDPQNRGAGTGWFRLYYPILGEAYMKAFMLQEPMVMRDKRLEVEWLARGKYSLIVGGNPNNLLEFRKAGAPIQPVETKEGNWIQPSSGIIQMAVKPPYPNAATLFMNWFLTKEGQTLMSEENLIPSLRVDVPTSHLDPDVVPKPGKAYLPDVDARTTKAEEYIELSAKLFAPILGLR